jgi:hypothetical protein
VHVFDQSDWQAGPTENKNSSYYTIFVLQGLFLHLFCLARQQINVSLIDRSLCRHIDPSVPSSSPRQVRHHRLRPDQQIPCHLDQIAEEWDGLGPFLSIQGRAVGSGSVVPGAQSASPTTTEDVGVNRDKWTAESSEEVVVEHVDEIAFAHNGMQMEGIEGSDDAQVLPRSLCSSNIQTSTSSRTLIFIFFCHISLLVMYFLAMPWHGCLDDVNEFERFFFDKLVVRVGLQAATY